MEDLTPLERHVVETALAWREAMEGYATDETIKEMSFWRAVDKLREKREAERPQSKDR